FAGTARCPRININFRNQWASITPNPYKTMSAWGDVQLFNDRFESGWVGLGAALLRDVAGSGGLTATRGFASIAYHQLLGYNSLLSGGFNVGFINKRIDLSKLTFDRQWNGKFFDVTAPSGENFAYNSVTYLDLQAGLNYAIFPTENAYINIGFSAMHINRPRESFFADEFADVRIDPRFTLFLNGSFKLNDQWILNPNVYVSKMGTAYETVAGLNAHYNLSGDGRTQLIGGLYVRLKDAFIPMAGFQLNDLAITVNYDATTSALGAYNQTRGAYELSVVKTGLFSANGKAVKCPSIKF
ncbi:MAG: PorP/SprF family type IX secretion system membrane protein, partial [Panacibacter sp.]